MLALVVYRRQGGEGGHQGREGQEGFLEDVGLTLKDGKIWVAERMS